MQLVKNLINKLPVGLSQTLTLARRYIFLLDIVAADDFRYKFHNRYKLSAIEMGAARADRCFEEISAETE